MKTIILIIFLLLVSQNNGWLVLPVAIGVIALPIVIAIQLSKKGKHHEN